MTPPPRFHSPLRLHTAGKRDVLQRLHGVLPRGFTLVEALVAVLLLSLLLTFALPAGHRWLQRQRLWHAAETVLADLYFARSEALHGSRNVMLRFLTTPSGACYVIYSGPQNSCQCETEGPSTCLPGGQAYRTYQAPRRDGFPMLSSNVSSMLFSNRLGTVALAATFRLSTEGVGEVRHIVGITGRVRSCSADRSFTRWPACEGVM